MSEQLVSKKELSDRRAAAIVAVATAFFTPFASTSFNVAVPLMGKEFGSNASSISWVVSAFIFASVAAIIPFGKIADSKGKRMVLLVGVFIFTVSSAATAIANTLPLVIICRIFQGVGGAMTNCTNIPILIEIYPDNMRGKALGMTVSSVYFGMTAGPVVGGLATHYFGWRAVPIFISVVALFALIVTIFRLPKTAGRKPEDAASKKINVFSIILYVVSIIAVMYGFTTIGQNNFSYFCFVIGAILLVVYIRREFRVPNPIVEVRLWKNNINYTFSNITALLNYSATFAVSYLVSMYLQMSRGFDADITGIILISQTIMQAFISPVAGKMSDKKSPYTLATVGMILCTISLGSYIFVNNSSSIVHVIINLVIVGVGIGFFTSPNTNAIMSAVEQKDYSVASSIVSGMRFIGQIISMAIITIIMNAFIGDIPIADADPKNITFSMNIACIVFTILCGIGVFISFQRKGAKS